jgi:hypothetical protein
MDPACYDVRVMKRFARFFSFYFYFGNHPAAEAEEVRLLK